MSYDPRADLELIQEGTATASLRAVAVRGYLFKNDEIALATGGWAGIEEGQITFTYLTHTLPFKPNSQDFLNVEGKDYQVLRAALIQNGLKTKLYLND